MTRPLIPAFTEEGLLYRQGFQDRRRNTIRLPVEMIWAGTAMNARRNVVNSIRSSLYFSARRSSAS